MHTYSLLGLLLAAQPFVFCDEDVFDADDSTPIPINMGYNPPFHPFAKRGANLWVRGDALYWKASEDNLLYTYKASDLNDSRDREIKTIDIDWDWGFRLGTGYTIPHDRWDLSLYWTRFHTSDSSITRSGTNTSLTVNWWLSTLLPLIEGNVNISVEGHWHPRLDQLDLTVGREFFVSRRLTLRPCTGLRTAWINQQFNVTLHKVFSTDPGNTRVDAITKMKNDFWGIGFLAGLDTKWMLANDWHLFANGALSILWGKFDISMKGTYNHERFFRIKEDFNAAKGILDAQAGVEWAHLFCSQRFGITLRAGYEYHLYADQNQLPLPTGDGDNSFSPVGGDLAYQGLFLSGQFDF